jgi:hypothetical protein
MIMRNSVVLPAPLGPMTPTMAPLGSSNERLSNSSLSPKPLLELFRLDDLVAEPRAGRDVDLVGLVALLVLARRQFLEAGHARLALGLASLRVGAHPLEFLLHGLDAGALGLGFLLEALLLLLQPGRVVALPGNAVAAVELEDPAGDVVEEIAVVRHGDHGAGVLVQETLQPGHRLRVEVVGRLVEQQHVGARQQQAAQRDAAPLAARQPGDVGLPGRQAQRVGGDLHGAVGGVPAGGLQQVLQLGLLLGEGVEIRVRLGIGGVDLVQARLRALDVAERVLDVAAHVLVRVELRLLFQVADADAGLGARLALDLGVDAGHDPQQRRLAEPFRPSTPILAPGKKDREMSRRMNRLGGTTFATRFIVYMYWAMVLGLAVNLRRGIMRHAGRCGEMPAHGRRRVKFSAAGLC